MINARIYNYSNLKVQDKVIIISQLILIKDFLKMEEDFEPDEPSYMENIFYGLARKVLAIVKKQLFKSVTDTMVALIDRYKNDVEEIDTDDYLFGLSEDMDKYIL